MILTVDLRQAWTGEAEGPEHLPVMIASELTRADWSSRNTTQAVSEMWASWLFEWVGLYMPQAYRWAERHRKITVPATMRYWWMFGEMKDLYLCVKIVWLQTEAATQATVIRYVFIWKVIFVTGLKLLLLQSNYTRKHHSVSIRVLMICTTTYFVQKGIKSKISYIYCINNNL